MFVCAYACECESVYHTYNVSQAYSGTARAFKRRTKSDNGHALAMVTCYNVRWEGDCWQSSPKYLRVQRLDGRRIDIEVFHTPGVIFEVRWEFVLRILAIRGWRENVFSVHIFSLRWHERRWRGGWWCRFWGRRDSTFGHRTLATRSNIRLLRYDPFVLKQGECTLK